MRVPAHIAATSAKKATRISKLIRLMDLRMPARRYLTRRAKTSVNATGRFHSLKKERECAACIVTGPG
jgi:hypothetical protein